MLLKICMSKDPTFTKLAEDCEYLNTHYIETRYPVHRPTHFSHEEAEKSLQSEREIYILIIKEISGSNGGV